MSRFSIWCKVIQAQRFSLIKKAAHKDFNLIKTKIEWL